MVWVPKQSHNFVVFLQNFAHFLHTFLVQIFQTQSCVSAIFQTLGLIWVPPLRGTHFTMHYSFCRFASNQDIFTGGLMVAFRPCSATFFCKLIIVIFEFSTCWSIEVNWANTGNCVECCEWSGGQCSLIIYNHRTFRFKRTTDLSCLLHLFKQEYFK